MGPPGGGGKGTPRPDAGGVHDESSALRFVEDSTLRSSEDFSRDTPQPKLVSSKRGYLHRRAKEGSPFGKGVPAGYQGGDLGSQVLPPSANKTIVRSSIRHFVLDHPLYKLQLTVTAFLRGQRF